MKRTIFVATLILISSNCYAGTISIKPFISGNDVSIASLETQRTTIQNVINGGIAGGVNIQSGSLVSQDFATSVSIVKFRDEVFNDLTYTGHLPVTDATLTSNISAGTSYVNGVRIETSAQSHTYTASKDTYVYINAGGFFDFQEVANGASAPSTPANDLLLAKVVTSGTAITSVSDLRTLSIQITATTSNFPSDYRNQCFVSRDSTTTMHAEPGNIAIGTTIYTRTTDTSTKTLATGTNWIEGSTPATNGRIFLFAYNDSGSTWDFKYSSADVAFSDTSSNTGGVLRYYTTGGVTYRAIGWAYKSADAIQLEAFSNHPDMSVRNHIVYSSSTQYINTSASLVNDAGMPLIQFYSSGGAVRITYNVGAVEQAGSFLKIGIMVDGVDKADTARWTDTTGTGASNLEEATTFWEGDLARGMHTIQGRFCGTGGSATVNQRRIIVEEI